MPLHCQDFKIAEGEPLPLMIQKSDGGYGYDATDMAAIRYRIEHEQFDRLISSPMQDRLNISLWSLKRLK